MDKLTPSRRSNNMRRIRSKDTTPEMAVRRLVHRLGYRYRLHKASLPGKPDLVFVAKRKVIFVHGCFWHQHRRCKISRIPLSNQPYWIPKLARNTVRDKQHNRALRASGWDCLIIWECESENEQLMVRKLRQFFGP